MRSKAERAQIAAESLVPGASVADVARRHGATRWQVYDWRKKLRTGQLVVPESLAALPMFAELVLEGDAAKAQVRGEERVFNRSHLLVEDGAIDVAVKDRFLVGISKASWWTEAMSAT